MGTYQIQTDNGVFQVETQEQPSFTENLVKDIKENNPVTSGYNLGKNIVPILQGLKEQYQGQQSITNTPIENIIAGLKSSVVPLAENVAKDTAYTFTHPSERPYSAAMLYSLPLGIMSAGKEGAESIINKAGGKFVGVQEGAEDIPKSILFNEPINNSTLALPVNEVTPKNVAAKISEYAEKSGIKPQSGNSLQVSKLIAGNLQPSTIENLSNPEVLKNVTPDMALKVPEYLDKATEAIENAHDEIKNAQIYKKLGIDDSKTRVDLSNPILSGDNSTPPITPTDAMSDRIDKFVDSAITPDQIKASKNAYKIWGNIVNKIGDDGKITFGQSKDITQSLYGEANKYVDNRPIYQLFKGMGDDVSNAKNSIPEIKQASQQFKDLLQAKELLEQNFPSLASDTGNFKIEKSLMRRYKDEGNQAFKDNLNQAAQILAKYPESKPLSNFTNHLDTLNVALDLEKTKAASALGETGGLSNIPGIKQVKNALTMSPATKVNLLKKGILSGVINPDMFKTSIPENESLFVGKPLNRVNAYKSILNLPKIF